MQKEVCAKCLESALKEDINCRNWKCFADEIILKLNLKDKKCNDECHVTGCDSENMAAKRRTTRAESRILGKDLFQGQMFPCVLDFHFFAHVNWAL